MVIKDKLQLPQTSKDNIVFGRFKPVSSDQSQKRQFGGGNGGWDNMETKISKLEADVSNINTQIGDIKADIREIRLNITGSNSQLNGRLDSYFWGIIGIFLLTSSTIGYLYVHINNKTDEIRKELRTDFSEIRSQNSLLSKEITEMKSDINNKLDTLVSSKKTK